MQQDEAEKRLADWQEASRTEVQRVRHEMQVLSDQLHDLSLENGTLRSEREGLLHTLADARRAQSAAEEAIGRLEFHMREMETEMQQEREAEQRSSQQVDDDIDDVCAAGSEVGALGMCVIGV